MLNNLLDSFKPESILNTLMIGEVIDNHDPKQIGRCRVKIPGINDTLPKDKMPWAHQLFPNGTGQDKEPEGLANGPVDGIPNFKIPAVGTKVVVMFPDDDIYSCLYVGELMYEPLAKQELLNNYPETWGTLDKINNRFWVDMVEGTVNFWHFTDTHFRIDKDGTINVYSVKDLNIDVEVNETVWVGGDKRQTIDGQVTEEIGKGYSCETGLEYAETVGTQKTIDAGVSIDLTAPIINLN